MKRLISYTLLGLFLAFAHAPIQSLAQTTAPAEDPAKKEEEKPAKTKPPVAAPYDGKLMRLAEVLGSIHYLRNLCGAKEGTKWRDHMTELIGTENPAAERRARMIARFNRGYHAFEQVYATCTPSALLAADRYMKEGVRLSSQITSRYGR